VQLPTLLLGKTKPSYPPFYLFFLFKGFQEYLRDFGNLIVYPPLKANKRAEVIAIK